ncbi:hypothetical protein [Lysobacter enzymogenes]|uniref:hypothetical protein n=1 Tax=Lysobacter enzymogenes TaxID=69 RepID=UPI00089530D3|nr:hypothetical protein [Lysobacter enzymogenes]SDW94273.1 hypothetical protein SAMN05421681_103292 [Lysobacter enzymogenes]
MTTEPRPILSDDDVLTLLLAGCNAREIQAYAGVSNSTAVAMVLHAQRQYTAAPTAPQLRLPR